MSINKKLWLIPLILLAIIGLRESGRAIFHYANSQFNNRMQIDLHSDFFDEKNGRRLPSSEKREITSQQPIIAVLSWNSGFNTSPQATILTSIRDRVQRRVANEIGLQVRLQNVELSGLYWLPLYKSGVCEYQFDVEVDGENTRTYKGNGTGEIEFSSFGTISITEVKDKLSEQIAGDIVSTLRRETK